MSTTFTASLTCGGVRKNVLLYPGVPLDELKSILAASFHTSANIVGLKDESRGIHFPLSLLSKSPANFQQGTYDLVLVKSAGSSSDAVEEDGSLIYDLGGYNVHELLQLFKRAAPSGSLDRESFQKCFHFIVRNKDGSAPTDYKRTIGSLNRLFNIFDKDGNGVVDAAEFMSGLSVLASGDRDDKIRAAFDLYDTNRDGFISLNEMARYLTSVFSVIAETSPHIFQQHGVDPSELGKITARQCFQEADTDHDGHLSFEEFRRWYSKPGYGEFNQMIGGQQQQKQQALPGAGASSSLPPLDEIRTISGMGLVEADDVFDIFQEVAPHGDITPQLFEKAIRQVASLDPSYSAGRDEQLAILSVELIR